MKLLSLIVFLHLVSRGNSQDSLWTWLGGSKKANVLESNNDPGGRSGAAYWVEPIQKAVWVFGGEHHVEHGQPGLRNDLWKLDVATMTWQEMHNGTGQAPKARQLAAGCGIQGAYFVIFGGLGEGEAVLGDMWLFYIPEGAWYKLDDFRTKLGARNSTYSYLPDARGDSAAWCQTDFHLTLFGGFDKSHMLLHDMWKFDMQQLSWAELDSSSKLPSDPDFVSYLWYPSGRSGATTWLNNSKLYMFGGNIQHKNVRSKHLLTGNAGDIWQYDSLTDEWVYLTGSRKMCLEAGNYGSIGVASDTNQPGCRRRAASWTDTLGNLWMFGGDGVDDSQSSISVFKHSKLLSDVWHFDTNSNQWTWKGGMSVGDSQGNFGDRGGTGINYLPGSRCEAVTWRENNTFYLFGGVGHDAFKRDGYLNDVWKLSVETDSLVMGYIPSPGAVFGLIFLGLGLMTVVFIGFMCNRGYFSVKDQEQKGQYRRLAMETENLS